MLSYVYKYRLHEDKIAQASYGVSIGNDYTFVKTNWYLSNLYNIDNNYISNSKPLTLLSTAGMLMFR